MSTSAKRLQWCGCLALAAGAVGLELTSLLAWLSLGLLLLACLKLAEARTTAERRLVALLQLLIAGLLAGQRPELLPSLGQLLAVALALAGLLQLEAGEGQALAALLRRSLALLLAALPLALLLFLVTPRLGPLWPAASGLNGQALTGLSAELDPGAIANLARDDSPAARVSFSAGQPPPPGQRTWRVLVHSRFDGARWLPADPPPPRFRPPLPAAGPSQLWLVEPSLQQAMPWDGRSLPATAGPRIDAAGELLLQRPPASRRSLLLVADAEAERWRRVPPGMVDRLWPSGSNPRLEALGRSWRGLPPDQRLAAARQLLGSGRYRYTLQPGRLPERGGLDVLLFERRAGFCGHYASALAALMRAAGVPARVVSGYQGGTWVPLLTGGGYLELRQSDAHAWSELWLDGRWQSVDPSAWVGPAIASLDGVVGQVASGFSARLLAQWWGVELAWSRWWIGFDQGAQQALLRRLLGEQVPLLGWILLLVLALWMGLVWRAGRWPRLRRDPLGRALRRWRRLGVTPLPGETLPRLVERLVRQRPELADQARQLARDHQRRRFGRPGADR